MQAVRKGEPVPSQGLSSNPRAPIYHCVTLHGTVPSWSQCVSSVAPHQAEAAAGETGVVFCGPEPRRANRRAADTLRGLGGAH